jgi:hypothetical protein
MDKKPAWFAVRSALRHRTLDPSSVGSVRRDGIATHSDVYTLDGRRVSGTNLHPGIYIKNGKKCVIK